MPADLPGRENRIPPDRHYEEAQKFSRETVRNFVNKSLLGIKIVSSGIDFSHGEIVEFVL